MYRGLQTADTTGLSSPPSLCAQFSGAVGTPSLVAGRSTPSRRCSRRGAMGRDKCGFHFAGGEEVSRGVSDQGVRGGGKPRDVVLQALPCGLSPGRTCVSSCRWLWGGP